jgi:FAD synthetase
MTELIKKLLILEKDPTNTLGINKELVLKTCKLVREAILLIERCFDIFPGQISFSFNGGKDSTVVLHLIRMALAEKNNLCNNNNNDRNSSQSNSNSYFSSFYFKNNQCFDEEIEFINSTCKVYNINLKFFDCQFKEGLVKLTKEDGIRIVVMGTRRSDPHGEHLERLSPSSPGWPNFLRLNPCLDWKYNDIWNFLRLFNLSYCHLYDKGYTSIGSRSNTIPNEALKIDENKYKPAYMLKDASTERAGSRK